MPAMRLHRVALAICDQIGGLAKFPESGRPGRRQDTRELSISGLPYLAVYRIREDVGEILRVFHGAQDWT
jgi:toxin ParE1/3/4